MEKEKLIKEIMADLECTREEAEEVAEMEIKAKGIKNYTQGDKIAKPKQKKEKKIDLEKAKIIEILCKALQENGYSAEIKNIDKEIIFDCYSVNLVKHRPPKK